MTMTIEQKQCVDQYVERQSGDAIAEAYLRGYGIDVWALVMYYLEAADRNADVVARDYWIPREAVDAALLYYDEYRSAIDAYIRDNREAL